MMCVPLARWPAVVEPVRLTVGVSLVGWGRLGAAWGDVHAAGPLVRCRRVCEADGGRIKNDYSNFNLQLATNTRNTSNTRLQNTSS